MPISNGKYINPGWNNGAPPAIDAAELNAISTTLENLDANGGGSGKRYASVVVGTTTGGWTQADCDYLCDGTADQVQINAAIASLNGGNGEVKFLSGTYNLSSEITISQNSSISFVGSGHSTVLQNAQPGNTSIGTNNMTGTSISISNLKWINFSIYGQIGVFIANDCYFVNMVSSFGASRAMFKGNYLYFPDGYQPNNQWGISVVSLSDEQAIISNNTILVENTNTTYLFPISATSTTSVICGNYITFTATDGTGILASGATTVSGNFLDNCSINCDDGTACGNCLKNGTIIIRSGTASSNYIEDGGICSYDLSQVSGNYIYQKTPFGNGCIVVVKFGNNGDELGTKNISGNTCVGGEVGIYLASVSGHSYPNNQHANVTGNSCTSAIPLKIDSNWSNCLITGNMFPNGPIVDNGSSNTKANNITG